MLNFIKRHSLDMNRRNNKGNEKGTNNNNKNNNNDDDDMEVSLAVDEITREASGIVIGEDIVNDKIKHIPVEEEEIMINPCERLSFNVGVCENKNSKYRRTMEDVHTYVANFCERLDWGYFGVFDGHAGKQTARWAGTNLHDLLYESIMNDKFTDLRENLNASFLKADEEIKNLKGVGSSGCTAAVAVLRWEEEVEEEEEGEREEKEKEKEKEKEEEDKDFNYKDDNETEQIQEKEKEKEQEDKELPFDFIPSNKHKRILYTANVGDTRIILNSKGKAKRLTYEHKGSDKNEIKRIYKNGGLVLGGRVNGVLAVSRSLGDIYLKDHVLGVPYTTMVEINKDDKFLIIACDGLWDVCDDQKAVDLIDNIEDAKIASEILCNYAIKNGTGDNVTVMVVMLNSQIFGLTKV